MSDITGPVIPTHPEVMTPEERARILTEAQSRLQSIGLRWDFADVEPVVKAAVELQAENERLREALRMFLLFVDYRADTLSLEEIERLHGHPAAWRVKEAREALGIDPEGESE